MSTKPAGPTASALKDWKKWFSKSTGNGSVELSGRILIGGTGTVSACQGDPGLSAISNTTIGTGGYRVYFPPNLDVTPFVCWGGAGLGVNPMISLVSPTSGYFDLIITSSGHAVTTPASGDYIHFSVSCRESKPIK